MNELMYQFLIFYHFKKLLFFYPRYLVLVLLFIIYFII